MVCLHGGDGLLGEARHRLAEHAADGVKDRSGLRCESRGVEFQDVLPRTGLLAERGQLLISFAVTLAFAVDELNGRRPGPFPGEAIRTSLALVMSGSKTQSGACGSEGCSTTAGSNSASENNGDI